MNIIQYIVFLLLGLVHPQAKVPQPTYPAPILAPTTLEKVKGFTVLISEEGFEGVDRGTGVLIDKTHILTCAHMINRSTLQEYWIYTYPMGNVILAHPTAEDKEHDLAIFELSKPVRLKHYVVFASSTTLGQPIVVVGNILGSMRWFVSYGMISDKEGFYDLTTATIRGGNSGGPWVNLNGDVVALTDWGLENSKGEDENISGGIDTQQIQAFLEAWKSPSLLQQILGALQ